MFALVSHSLRNICSWSAPERSFKLSLRRDLETFSAVSVWVRMCVCELSHLGQAVSDCDLWSALFAVIWLENPTKRKRHKATTSQPPTCHTPFSPPLLFTHFAITAICPCDLYSITCQSFTNCCVELPFPSSHKSLFNGASNFLFSSSPSLSFSHCLTAAPYAACNHNNNLFTRWTIYLFIFIPFGRRLICFLDLLTLPAAEQKIQKSKTRSTKHKK